MGKIEVEEKLRKKFTVSVDMKDLCIIFIFFVSFSILSLNVLATDIDSCQELNESDSYFLTQDIINSSTSFCFNVSADNVTLDCQGHMVGGTDVGLSMGIYTNRNYTTIKNCTLGDWEKGIRLSSSYFSNISNVNTSSGAGSSSALVSLDQSSNNTLTDIRAVEEGSFGFRVSSSNYNVFTRCYVNGSSKTTGDGFYLSNSDYNEFYACQANETGGEGFWFGSGSEYNYVENCLGQGNDLYNIWIDDSDNNNITNSNFDKGEIINIAISGTSSNNTLYNTTASSSIGSLGFIGIFISSPNNTIDTVEANNICCDGNIGIQLKANNNIVKNSKIENNTYGIWIGSGYSNNKIFNNLFNNTDNVYLIGTINQNIWNTTRQLGTRIYSAGNYIGGNYWTNSTGNGYSDTCTDSNTDGFCDNAYDIGANGSAGYDYLAYSNKYENITSDPYCGDGTCDPGESCSSCLEDCDSCSLVIGGPGTFVGVGCTYNWTCTDWSECVNEIQTRTCTNLGTCTDEKGKPAESQACAAPTPSNVTSSNVTLPNQTPIQYFATSPATAPQAASPTTSPSVYPLFPITPLGLGTGLISVIAISAIIIFIILRKKREQKRKLEKKQNLSMVS